MTHSDSEPRVKATLHQLRKRETATAFQFPHAAQQQKEDLLTVALFVALISFNLDDLENHLPVRWCLKLLTFVTSLSLRFTMEQRLYTEEGISWSHIEWTLVVGSCKVMPHLLLFSSHQ